MQMLRELHISNLAVISDARIELAPGLNCFTGATGAGKSLVIGALEVLLGLRNPSEMLRPGADEGRVSGLFELRDPAMLKQIEAVTDAPIASDGGELLITRRLYASGRTSATLNGHPITLGMLKQASELLVDVHGQHDHQYLLKPSNQLDVVDHFANLWDTRNKYHETYTRLIDVQRQLSELETSRTLRQQQLDLYRFQADEIDAAQLDPAEMDELHARASVLANLEKLKKEAGAAHAALYAADGAVLERLKMTAAVLSELSQLDVGLADISKSIRDATLQLDEASFDLSRYLDRLDLDPAELVEVNDRLNIINRILNKYGDPIATTLAYREEIARKIIELARAGTDQSELVKELEPLTRQLKRLGDDLSLKRRSAANTLAPLIEKQLAELGMDKAKFSIAISPSPGTPGEGRGEGSSRKDPHPNPLPDYRERGLNPTPTGFDALEFIIQTNPGLSPQPLRKIASGGELSRIMLALKSVLAQGDRVSVLVFDEIDANVGGRLGSIIGNKLRKLAARHQVLCITHLPQIASYADRHLTVRKESDGRQTRTSVREIDGDERLAELSEMIGGQRVTDTTRAQARELLESARSEFVKPQSEKPVRAKRVM
jgi:DNA repair protein RecN (Recombination protein N)